MRHRMSKPYGLNVRRYAACLVDLNNYLAVLPGSKVSYNICVMELNEILINSMRNICINQEYVKGFYCGYITFKAYVNMFERMEIA